MRGPIHVGVDATTWWNDRGYGRFTREMLRALGRRNTGFRYTLVVDREPDGSLPNGMDVLVGRAQRSLTEAAVGAGSRSPQDMWHLARAVATTKFDVFWFPAVYSYYPLPNLAPCVTTFMDTIAERFPRLTFPTRKNELLWRTKTRLAVWQSRRAMTLSHSSARDLHSYLGIPADRIDVLSLGADPSFRVLSEAERDPDLRHRYGIPEAARLFAYAGGLNPHKNVLALIDAMPRVLDRHGDVHLALVGDTSGKGFHDNVHELTRRVEGDARLRQHVHFTGFVADEELVQLLNAAEALLFPSLYEGFGLPPLEAMCCGTPALTSDRASLPEVVGEAGLMFNPERPEDIANAWLRFVEEDGLAQRLRERLPEQVARHSWERGAELAEASFLKTMRRR